MNSGLNALLRLRHHSTGSGRDFLRASVRAASRFLAATEDFLPAVFPSFGAGDQLAGRVTRVDHVGCILGGHPPAVLESEARAGGFPENHHVFPSRILARELGALLQRDEVPTTVFIARERSTGGWCPTIELFMPAELNAGLWRELTTRGMTMHIGLAVASREDLTAAARLMELRGFRPPSCMREPLSNQAEGVVAQYFNGLWLGEPLRLELCFRDAAPLAETA